MATSPTEDDRRFVRSIALRMVKDADAADDVTQDALLLAFRYRDSFRGDSQYRTWLYRIAMSAAISHIRRQRRRPTIGLEAAAATPAAGHTPEEHLALVQLAQLADAELAAMGATGEVMRLRFVEGLSEVETAAALGLTVATVKIRTHRARRDLRASVEHARAG